MSYSKVTEEETMESFMRKALPEAGDTAKLTIDGQVWSLRHMGSFSYGDEEEN